MADPDGVAHQHCAPTGPDSLRLHNKAAVWHVLLIRSCVPSIAVTSEVSTVSLGLAVSGEEIPRIRTAGALVLVEADGVPHIAELRASLMPLGVRLVNRNVESGCRTKTVEVENPSEFQ